MTITHTTFGHSKENTSKMVHAAAIEEFEKKDTELTVPPGEPRPLLLVVMVSPASVAGAK